MENLELRDYQKECLEIINNLEDGKHLIVMAVGLGKTVVFSQIKRRGKVLILSHRDELVHQPIKYYDCPCGVEQANEVSHGEEVISASVQSLRNDKRLAKFSPDEFDLILIDEAHHAPAKSYRKIVEYFNPRLILGFTATPNRRDGVGLNNCFDDIIFERDLKWGIENHYLSDIKCLQVDLKWDISKVKKKGEDFDQVALAQCVNQDVFNRGVRDAYEKYANGQTVIFAASVDHCYALKELIPNSEVIEGKTKNRDILLERFRNNETNVLINFGVLTEGTDLPNIETVIMARPTRNQSLYMQCVGRGTRLYPGKEKMILLDCVGYTGKNPICTAPKLFGLDLDALPEQVRDRFNGMDISEMEDMFFLLNERSIESWVVSAKEISLFTDDIQTFNNYGVFWKAEYDGSLKCTLLKGYYLLVTAPDLMGNVRLFLCRKKEGELFTHLITEDVKADAALQMARSVLQRNFKDMHNRGLWDVELRNQWGTKPASIKQVELIYTFLRKKKYKDLIYDDDFINNLTRSDASLILDHFFNN